MENFGVYLAIVVGSLSLLSTILSWKVKKELVHIKVKYRIMEKRYLDRKDSLTKLLNSVMITEKDAIDLLEASLLGNTDYILEKASKFFQHVNVFLEEIHKSKSDLELQRSDLDLLDEYKNELIELFISLELNPTDKTKYETKISRKNKLLQEKANCFDCYVRAELNKMP